MFLQLPYGRLPIKVKLGKLKADPKRLVQRIDASGMRELPVFSRTHCVGLRFAPASRLNPFDRLLIAQAMSEQLALLTTDSRLKQYSELVHPGITAVTPLHDFRKDICLLRWLSQ